MDGKAIGLKALDILVGIGAAVAGGTGGPEAAKGVMMAGGAIKDITNEATGGAEATRSERHDRADFQARDAAVAKQKQLAVADDRAASRAELLKLGWTEEAIEQILKGPPRQTSAPPAPGPPPPSPAKVPETVTAEEGSALAGVVGKLLKGSVGTKAQAQSGNVLVGEEGISDADAVEGVKALSALGTVLKTFTSKST